MFQILLITFALAGYSIAAPWSDDNNLNENDLEWQCTQLCRNSFGTPIFYEQNSTCICEVDKENSDVDWARLKRHAEVVGLVLEILQRNLRKIIKREAEETNIEKPEENDKVIDASDKKKQRENELQARLQAVRERVRASRLRASQNANNIPDSVQAIRDRISALRERVSAARNKLLQSRSPAVEVKTLDKN